MTIEVLAAFVARAWLVLLFLPFSALDKILNFRAAIGQAGQATASRPLAAVLILAGLFVEVVMSLGVLTGIADRFAAFVLAGYCAVTALLWKQFWRKSDFRLRGPSQGRETFWDFLKNFALAGGFLALAWSGPSAQGVAAFLHDPFGSTQPYGHHKTGDHAMSDQGEKPTVPYWHLHTAEDGVSRQVRCTMSDFHLASMKPPASPQWQGVKHHDGMTTMITIQPVGWEGTWHENPAPQWIIPLSGRWYVESMDGTRVEMGPGEISFGEDQGCGTCDGKTGHKSGTVGDEPAVLMVVQFDSKREHITPCRFR